MGIQEFKDILCEMSALLSGSRFDGHVFAVGGCVRDWVMNAPDIKDIDLVVDIRDGGIGLAEHLKGTGALAGEPVIYERFGTAMFRLSSHPDTELEAVHTRSEFYPDACSRKPEQDFGTMEDDCMRRDLTINALYVDIRGGGVLDPTGMGVVDIWGRILRTPRDPNDTYRDDPLRMLRCVRFASRYGWNVEERTLEGIRANAGRLSIISRERVHDELVKMMSAPHYNYGMELMRETGLCWEIGMEGEAWAEYEDRRHIIETLADITGGSSDYMLPVAMCFRSEDTLAGLKFTNDELRRYRDIRKASALALAFAADPSELNYNRFAYMSGAFAAEGIALAALNGCPDGHCVEVVWRMNNLFLMARRVRRDKSVPCGTSYIGFKMPFSGKDVMETLGLKPGKEVGEMLDALVDRVLGTLEPRQATREACLALL